MKNDKSVILLLVLIFFAVLPFFYFKQGLLLIDTGREFYIPQQMLNGGVLFKDIFNIYGALSYQINALLFLIFEQKLSVLYLAGIFNSLLIIITLYFLAREFFNKSISFLFSIFIMSALVFSVFLYNSNLTYCFAIVYALSSFLLSLLFLIKYTKNENAVYAYLSAFFAGISFAHKYEFIFYFMLLPYFMRSLGIKNMLKAFLCFAAAPAASYGMLLIQGLNFNDIKISAELICSLVSAPIVKKFFYGLSLTAYHNGIFSIFAVIPVLNIILLFLYRKEIIKNKPLSALILCAIAASAKSFSALNVFHMGIFLLPVCALALITMLNIKYKNFLPFFLAFCILLFSAEDFKTLKNKTFLLETDKGSIYTYKKDGLMIKTAYDYILENTKPSDKIVIMPEGSIINFLTGRKGDNTYYNLSPLFYYDVFGEKRILEHFNKNLPEYFIILPLDNIEYGYHFFGADYAQKFYEMIMNNYDLDIETNGIKIFKKKDMQ